MLDNNKTLDKDAAKTFFVQGKSLLTIETFSLRFKIITADTDFRSKMKLKLMLNFLSQQ